MTISVPTSTSETCPICYEDYTNVEREDTAKVVELACHHFHHIECISRWFSENENNGRDLQCSYCNQVSMPKIRSVDGTLQGLTRYFSTIEQDPYFGSKSEVMGCLKELKPRSESIWNALMDMLREDVRGSNGSGTITFKNWIQDNIPKESREMSCRLIGGFLSGGGTIRTLRQEIRNLSDIPPEKWSTEIGEGGIPVHDYTRDGNEFRMKVSTEYLQRATEAYLYRKKHNIPEFDRIHSIGKFEESLNTIEGHYFYDREVLDCIPDAKNLREDISNLIRRNSSHPTEEILSLLQEMVTKSNVNDNSKRTIPLLIHEVVFDRGALRTMSQEVDRWKKEPIGKWPSGMKENGIYFLDKDRSVKHCEIKDFEKRVTSKTGAPSIVEYAYSYLCSIVSNW